MTHFNTSRFNDASAIWQSAVKSWSRLRSYLKRAVPVIVGSNSLSWVKAVSRFSHVAYRIYRAQGSQGLALYLKAANLLLIRATSGRPLESSHLAGAAVSRTNRGLPRIISANHRARIRGGESMVIRLWLGFFTLYRVLDYRGRLSLKSIVEPGVELSDELLIQFRTFVRTVFMKMLKQFDIHPVRSELELLEGREPGKETWVHRMDADRKVLLTSGPTSKETAGCSVVSHGLDCFHWVLADDLYPYIHGIALITGNAHLLNSMPFQKAWEAKRDVKVAGPCNVCQNATEGLGRLSIRVEPGKLRVFAMVDSLTQWLLYPLHKILFSMLAKIPQDGTFDQTRPVKALLDSMKERGLEHVYSYDLSAATDRIPVLLQEILLSYIVSRNYAYMWRRLLCDRWYKVPQEWTKTFGSKHPGGEVRTWTPWAGNKSRPKGRYYESPSEVRYTVGQPMGAYSSWAMLAFIHHALVQFAAWRAGHRSWFSDYAVLGDDIVIANCDVADKYVRLMEEIGVGIGFHKSVISNNRSLEFAKRYFYKGEEVTPLPLLGIAVGWLGISMVPEVISASERVMGRTISLFNISRFLGFGFKAGSAAANKPLLSLPKTLRSALILLLTPMGPRGSVDWYAWLRRSSANSETLLDTTSRDGLCKYLVTDAKQRFQRLLGLLETNLAKFVPGHTFEYGETWFQEYCKWFEDYIVSPLRQDFMVQRMEIEGQLRGIRKIIMPTDKEISSLLESLFKFEQDIAAIPKTVARHKSQLAATSIPLLPGLVKKWHVLGRFVARTSGQRKRIALRLNRGIGGSPLLRSK